MIYFYIIISALIFLTACTPPGPVVQATIEFVASKETPPLNYIEAMSGADKALTGGIKPNESRTIKIYPSTESEWNEITLYITMTPGSEKWTSWEGKRFPPGSSYKTHIRIDEKGKVLSQRSCVMPCEL
jgi:hypothetical protein